MDDHDDDAPDVSVDVPPRGDMVHRRLRREVRHERVVEHVARAEPEVREHERDREHPQAGNPTEEWGDAHQDGESDADHGEPTKQAFLDRQAIGENAQRGTDQCHHQA